MHMESIRFNILRYIRCDLIHTIALARESRINDNDQLTALWMLISIYLFPSFDNCD